MNTEHGRGEREGEKEEAGTDRTSRRTGDTLAENHSKTGQSQDNTIERGGRKAPRDKPEREEHCAGQGAGGEGRHVRRGPERGGIPRVAQRRGTEDMRPRRGGNWPMRPWPSITKAAASEPGNGRQHTVDSCGLVRLFGSGEKEALSTQSLVPLGSGRRGMLRRSGRRQAVLESFGASGCREAQAVTEDNEEMSVGYGLAGFRRSEEPVGGSLAPQHPQGSRRRRER